MKTRHLALMECNMDIQDNQDKAFIRVIRVIRGSKPYFHGK